MVFTLLTQCVSAVVITNHCMNDNEYLMIESKAAAGSLSLFSAPKNGIGVQKSNIFNVWFILLKKTLQFINACASLSHSCIWLVTSALGNS